MRTFFKLLFAVCLPVFAFSQIRIVTSVSKNPVEVGERFELTFTVKNYAVKKIALPSLEDFESLSGPNTSTSIQWVNGVMTESGSYTYSLKAKATGRFNIGKASVSDTSKTYYSDELIITVTEKQEGNLPPDAKASDAEKGAVQRDENYVTLGEVFESPVERDIDNDSLYFKDGKGMPGKAIFIQSCANGMNGSKKKKNDIKVDAEGACSCMIEIISKNYTYAEFKNGFDKEDDFIEKIISTESPVYKDVLNCVFSNMLTGSEKNTSKTKEKSVKKETSFAKREKDDGDDVIEKLFMESCTGEATKTKAFKQSGIDADVYCQCTWDKIEEKGLALDKLSDLKDPNSPIFNEIITPCITQAMTGKGYVGEEKATKNENDIVGENQVERISLTRLMGIYKIKVKIGSVEKYFTLDSGANDVFINEDTERDLLLDGVIKKSDYLPSRKYRMADGSYTDCRRLKLDGIQVGDFTVNNVVVAISEDSNGLLLLGKSLLDKFSSWSIDNKTEELVLTK